MPTKSELEHFVLMLSSGFGTHKTSSTFSGLMYPCSEADLYRRSANFWKHLSVKYIVLIGISIMVSAKILRPHSFSVNNLSSFVLLQTNFLRLLKHVEKNRKTERSVFMFSKMYYLNLA